MKCNIEQIAFGYWIRPENKDTTFSLDELISLKEKLKRAGFVVNFEGEDKIHCIFADSLLNEAYALEK